MQRISDPIEAQMNPRFARYIEPAKAKSQLWRLGLGLMLGTVIYYAFTLSILLVGASFGLDIENALSGQAGPPETAVLLLSFLGMTFAVILVLRLLHGRDLMSVIGPDPVEARRHFIIAAVISFAISIASFALYLMAFTPNPNLPLPVWLAWLPFSLILVLIQTSAEELVFRGYIQQQLAARFASPLIWWLLPSALFGLMHYSPETYGANTWLVVIGAGLIGLVAADVTARTGNLGAAIAIHFVNNTMAILFIAPLDDLNGLALNVGSFSAVDIDAMRLALQMDIAVILVCYYIYLRIMRQRGF
ncbi:MAG: CPBP family intramembrane metalloprotease [Alphaproteobacteria bacterium]|nr:CPBP family intramembrane metalloprotease [Alphaproteobacteria bacterium]